ncbi:mitochondrial phosphate carrier protein [Aspergillus alliaceus]|uniref:Mitochondrial phosphate carrier protein n=1 Tax=Petromyces alliaceus TaxID=209559 RepID=A0A8H6AD90_PETAA|nr:mitochondrial phosphate carrier protein [Aspergillus burnettii]
MFNPRTVRLISGTDIDRLMNALTLTHDLHRLFGNFEIAFEPIDSQPQTYKIKYVNAGRIFRGHWLPVTRTLYITPGRSIEQPSIQLSELHHAIGQILHSSAAGKGRRSCLHSIYPQDEQRCDSHLEPEPKKLAHVSHAPVLSVIPSLKEALLLSMLLRLRIQLDPVTYNRGLIGGFRQVIQNEGAGALLTGAGLTFAGYFLQGTLKFGGAMTRSRVESSETLLADNLRKAGDKPIDKARVRHRPDTSGFQWTASNAGEELSTTGRITFVVYEKVAKLAYDKFFDGEKTSDTMQTSINLYSGLIAGFAAAIVSQPADTMLSKINKSEGPSGESTTSRLIEIARE